MHLDSPFTPAIRRSSANALQNILEQADDSAVKDLDLLIYHLSKPGVRYHMLILTE